jgi:hypothetical protein
MYGLNPDASSQKIELLEVSNGTVITLKSAFYQEKIKTKKNKHLS